MMATYANPEDAPRPDCIPTTYSLNQYGYGRCAKTRYGERVQLAHRLAWIDFYGRLPLPKMQICHTCDWPACVNVEHLYEGTASDNLRDRHERNPKKVCKHGHPFVPGSYVLVHNRQKDYWYRQCVSCLPLTRFSLATKRRLIAEAAMLAGALAC